MKKARTRRAPTSQVESTNFRQVRLNSGTYLPHATKNTKEDPHMRYRPEIDGLRAVSVLAVLLYHLGATWLPGGFTGVDIFFVISGFLITSILRADIELGRFSLADFYARRIRRIFPALIAVLTVSTIAGYFLLAPGDFESLGKSTVAAAASFSNIFFCLHTGYFDSASDTLPLLHTWSLGVEEQFYVIFPLLLLLLSKTKWRCCTGNILATAVAIGLGLSLWRVHVDQKTAFYLVHYRAWELGAGALLAYHSNLIDRLPRRISQWMPAVGIGLVAISIFTPHPAGTFPGAGAVPAVLGAALILAQVGQASIINRWLTVPPLVYLGKISYSLYLWHWPLIVFWRHFTNGAPLTLLEQIIIGAASLAFAWLSWRWVETPFRNMRPTNVKAILVGVVSMTSVAIAGALIAHESGLPDRIPPQYAALQSKQQMWNWNCTEEVIVGTENLCIAGQKWTSHDEHAVVIGDSHAQHLMPLLHESGIRTGISIGLLANCPPIFKPERGGLRHVNAEFTDRCFDARKRLFELLRADPSIRTVIIAGLWPMLGYTVYRSDAEKHDVVRAITFDDDKPRAIAFSRGREYVKKELRDLIEELGHQGIRVIVVSDIPTFKRDPIPCVLANSGALLRLRCPSGSEFVTKSQMLAYQLPMVASLRETVSGLSNTSIVVPTDALCASERCEAYVDGQYLYRDADHLRRNMPPAVYAKLAETIGLTAALKNDMRARHREHDTVSQGTEARARTTSNPPG